MRIVLRLLFHLTLPLQWRTALRRALLQGGGMALGSLLVAAVAAAQVPDTSGAGGRWSRGQVFIPHGSGAAGSDERRRSFDLAGETARLDYRLNYAVQPLPGTRGEEPRLSASQLQPAPRLGQGVAKGRLDWHVNAVHRLSLAGSLSHADAVHARGVPAAPGQRLRHSRALKSSWLANWTDRYSTRVVTRGEAGDYGLRLQQGPVRTQLRGYLVENRWKLGRHALTASVRDDTGWLRATGAAPGHHQRAWSLAHAYKRRAHSLDLGLGYVRDSEFGDHATGKLSWDYAIVPQWQLSLKAGSSVELPALQRLHVDPDPAQEKRGVALHLDWKRDEEALGLAIYRRHVRELASLASADACGGHAICDVAGPGTQLQGLTLSGQTSLQQLDLGGSLQLQQPVDAESGLLLPRRATRVLKLNASTRIGAWQVKPQWQLNSRRYGDAAHRSQLAGYGRLDVQASAHFAPAWELMLGVDNVTDRHYRLSNSRSGPGRAWRVQLRWLPD